MDAMYSADINSDVASLTVSITDTETTISVDDVSKLPTPPNLAVIGPDTNNPETILYESVDATNNNLTTVTRGFQGTAQNWSSGVKTARMFTAYDHDTFKKNIEQLNNNLNSHSSNTSNPHTVTASQISLGNVENIALSNALWGDLGISKTDISHTDLQSITTDDHHSRYTDEESQDATNSLLTNSNSITLNYDDANNSLTIGESHSSLTNNPHSVNATQAGALVSLDGVSNAGGDIDLVNDGNVTLNPDNTNNQIGLSVPNDLTIISNYNTDDLTEGTSNKYYTDSRVDARLSGGTGIGYSAGNISHQSASVHESGGNLEITHNNLNISTDDHHAKYTDSEAVSAVNSQNSLTVNISGDADTLDGVDLANITWSDVNMTKYTDSEAVSAVNSQSSLTVDISGNADTLDGVHLANITWSDVNMSRYTNSEAVNAVDGNSISNLTITDTFKLSSVNSSVQRADARDEGTQARLHWYGKDENGNTTNFQHALYDGSNYINVTASSGAVNFTGQIEQNGNPVATENWVGSNYNNYSHPTYNSDDFSVDSGALSGATIIDDININVTTDGEGHVTDTNGTIATRNLNHNDLTNIGSSDHHTKYADSDAISAINNDGDHGSTASHNYNSYGDSDAISAIEGSSLTATISNWDFYTQTDDRILLRAQGSGGELGFYDESTSTWTIRQHNGGNLELDASGNINALSTLQQNGHAVATETWVGNNYNNYSLETHDNSHHSNNYYSSGDNPSFGSHIDIGSGSFQIEYNSTEDSLDFNYIG